MVKTNIFNKRIIMGKQIYVLFFIFIFCIPGLYANQDNWKKALIEDDKIEVKYQISNRENETGKKVPLIEFTTKTVEQIDFDDCIALMKDFSRHKDIMEAESSEMVRKISDSEWILYYLYPSAGPISASDVVMRYQHLVSENGKMVTFKLTAEPELIAYRGVARISYDAEIYIFRDLGNGNVEIEIQISTTPAVKVPKWILNLAFPDAAGDILKNIIEIIQE